MKKRGTRKERKCDKYMTEEEYKKKMKKMKDLPEEDYFTEKRKKKSDELERS